jgi:hypothetical protein
MQVGGSFAACFVERQRFFEWFFEDSDKEVLTS